MCLCSQELKHCKGLLLYHGKWHQAIENIKGGMVLEDWRMGEASLMLSCPHKSCPTEPGSKLDIVQEDYNII